MPPDVVVVPPPELPDPSEPWDVFVVPPADEPGVSVSAVSFPDTPPDSFPLPLFESLSGFSEELFLGTAVCGTSVCGAVTWQSTNIVIIFKCILYLICGAKF